MKKYWLVIAEKAGEGVLFDNEDDARHALTGDPSMSCGESALADNFAELYGDDDNLSMTTIEI